MLPRLSQPPPAAPDAGAPRPRERVGETLREPHLLALCTSNLIQVSSWTAQFVMLQWLVTTLTESRTVLGSVSSIQGLSIFLLSPLAGVAADRWSRRPLLIGCRLGLAAVVASIGGLVASGRIAVWQILVGTAVAGALTAFLQPATQAFVFDVVRRERAGSAIALNLGAEGLGRTLGPLWGGGAVAAVGFVGAYLSAAVGVGLAVLVLLTVPVVGRGAPSPSQRSWRADLGEVLRWVRHEPPVRLALALTSLAIFNGAVSAMRPAFARHVLEAGSAGYGMLAGAAGLGSLLTAFAIAARPLARRPGLVMGYSMLAFALGIVLYSLAFSYLWVLAVELWMGAASQVWNVYTFSALQMAVPDEMRGRVVSLVYTLVMLAPVGGLFVGMLADVAGDQLALAGFGIVPCAVLTIALIAGHRQLARL